MFESNLNYLESQHTNRLHEAEHERLKKLAIEGRKKNLNSLWRRFFRSPQK
jgi:hypothetical protein